MKRGQTYEDKCRSNLIIDMLVDPARLASTKLKEVACWNLLSV